jgi:DNA-binding CsgD family transcriptional regulator
MRGDLVSAIYDTVLHPNAVGTLVANLAQATGAVSGYFYRATFGADFALEGEYNIDAGFKRSYAKHYCRLNPFLSVVKNSRPGQIKGQPAITTTAQYRRSEFFNDWVRPQGWLQPSAVVLRNDEEGIDFLGFWHGPERGGLGRADICLLNDLAPHLRRANAALATVRESTAIAGQLGQSLAAAGFGVLLAEANGRIVFANQAAEKLLGHQPGQPGGPLLSDFDADHHWIRAAARRATSANPAEREGNAALLPRQGNRPPLTVHVLPMDAGQAVGGNPLATLFLIDPAQDLARRLIGFQTNFGLTGAETRLMEKILNGASLVEAARALNLREATLRTQMSRIFERTQAARQSDLIRLFFQSTLPGWANR